MSGDIQSLTTPDVDYTPRDYEQSFDRMVELFQSAYPGVDLTPPASLERLFLEALTLLIDKATYYMNRQAREAFIALATQRTNLLNLAKLVGYEPRGIAAAQAEETFTLGAVAGADVTIVKGTIVRTQAQANAVRFQLLDDLIIPAGDLSAVGTVENSVTQTFSVLSSGAADQSYALPLTPYLDLSASVSSNQGQWTEVQNFLDSAATDLHFRVDVDARDRAHITFGTGQAGTIPTGLIAVEYKTGGGDAGNVPAGAIRVVEGAFEDGDGFPVTVSVTNLEAAEGGFERESEAMIRVNAPAASRVPKNAVARTDFEDIALRVPGVGRVLHLTRNQDPGVPENRGLLIIVPADGGTASQALLDAVAAQFGDEVTVGDATIQALPVGPYPKTVTFQLDVRSAVYVTIDVTAKVVVAKGFAKSQVKANIVSSLSAMFAVLVDARTINPRAPAGLVPNPKVNFGYYLLADDGTPLDAFPFSDVYNAVHDAAGVLQVSDDNGLLLNDAALNVPIGRAQFPKLGTVRVIDARTAQEI